MSAELVFVTGASGFLGAHVVHQLLEKGYRVRAAARGAKAEHLQSTYAAAGYDSTRFSVVQVADIAHDEFPAGALAGVAAVMHLASPLPGGNASAEEMLRVAEEGTLNVLVQAERAGVRRMVVTASIASVTTPGGAFTDKDWNPVTRETALTTDNAFLTYQASKKFAELALWEWAEKHPHVEVTTFNPPFFYGPFAPHFARPAPGDFGPLSTNILMYHLLFPDGSFPPRTRYIDVRDVAKAHIAALNGKPTSEVGRKRMIIGAPTGWAFAQTVAYIRAQRPEIADGLIRAEPVVQESDVLPVDWERVERVLGISKEDFTSTDATTLDTIDALLELEKEWVAQGWERTTPPKMM